MLKKESIKYSSFNQSAQADYLHGNLQDDITIVMKYSIERVVFLSDDRHVWLTPPPHILGSVDNTRIIFDVDGQQSFTEFQQGDQIFLRSDPSEGYHTITEKIDNNTIRVSGAIPSNEIYGTDEFIACTKAPSSIRYRYNFISSEGSIDYINHLDGQEQLYEGNNIPSVVGLPISLTAQGSKSHQLGDVVVRCVEIKNTYKFVYELTHRTKLFPILKDGYVQALQSGNILEDWAGALSYNYAYNIELLKEEDNELDKISIEDVESGNTGSYNEHFNTAITGFSVFSIEYTLAGNTIDALDYNGTTTVKVVYKSDAKFLPTLRTEVTFLAVHEDFDNYLDTDQFYLDNFCYGRAGTSGILNIGNNYRVFTDFSQTIIDSSTLEVTFKVSLGSSIKANIEKSDPKKYALFITAEQNGITVPLQVRSRDLVDISDFVETLPFAQLINTSSQFWLDPADAETGYIQALPDTFMTDDVLAVSQFSFPKTLNVKVLSVKNDIIATGTGGTVVLDTITTSLVSSPLDPNGIQIPSISTLRPLNQSYKSTLLIGRGTDTGTDYVFSMVFPFIVGYREDKAITNQSIPSEVYELGAVGNGLSSDWFRYVDNGMSIKYRVTYTMEYLGKNYSQVYEKPINVNDYDNPEWTAKSIKLYDPLGVELVDGVTPIIKNTVTIKAIFDKPVLPSSSDIECYFFVSKIGEDGYRTSSTYENSFKKIIFGSLNVVGGEVVATGELNAEDFKADVRIWCRLFERTGEPIPPCVLISEEGDYLIHETEGYLIPETCGEIDTDQIFDSQENYLKDSMGNRLKAL